MRSSRICSLIAGLTLVMNVSAQDYGERVTGEPVRSLSSLYGVVLDSGTVEAIVDGQIREVCQKKGCWMVVGDGDTEIRVTFKDYGFFIPKNAAGKGVRVKGMLKITTLSEEDARHFAEDAGKSKSDIENIKGMQNVVTMIASGVRIEGEQQ